MPSNCSIGGMLAASTRSRLPSRPPSTTSAEAAALRLDDIDWLAGTVTVRGKGGRTDRLPLPVDVGHVLVDYLRRGRPDTPTRTFVRAVAPFTALHATSISCIVARAARRAGPGTVHGHRLRHTTATETLNAGAGLEEGQPPIHPSRTARPGKLP